MKIKIKRKIFLFFMKSIQLYFDNKNISGHINKINGSKDMFGPINLFEPSLSKIIMILFNIWVII